MDTALKLKKARTALILDQPFFGVLTMRLDLVEDKTIPTAATDGKKILYNPEFINKFNTEEVKGILCHEILHCGLNHTTRRGTRDPQKWNVAGDFAINAILHDANITLPSGHLFSPEYSGLPTEEIYHRLPENPPQGQSCGEVTDSQGDGKDGQGTSKDEQQQMEREWKEAISQAAQYARKQGTLSAGLERFAGEAINPPADWRTILHQFVSSNAKNDFSWQRPNRRFIHKGLYLPSLHSPELPPIAIAVDTSGSIDKDILAQFQSELSNILETYNTTLRVIYCDSKINGEEEITEAPVVFHPKGGGGTDFWPVFKLLEENSPELLIYLTDGEGTFPDNAPDYPVLWALYGSIEKAPFGISIKLKAY